MSTKTIIKLESKSELLPNGCWQWHGLVNKAGYSRLGQGTAYRVCYELLVGSIPEGLRTPPSLPKPTLYQSAAPDADAAR